MTSLVDRPIDGAIGSSSDDDGFGLAWPAAEVADGMGKAAGARMMVRPRGGAPRHGRPLITPTPARAGGGATASYPASAAATPINYAKRHGPLRPRLPIEPGTRPVPLHPFCERFSQIDPF
jgi:hypothetical protein